MAREPDKGRGIGLGAVTARRGTTSGFPAPRLQAAVMLRSGPPLKRAPQPRTLSKIEETNIVSRRRPRGGESRRDRADARTGSRRDLKTCAPARCGFQP